VIYYFVFCFNHRWTAAVPVSTKEVIPSDITPGVVKTKISVAVIIKTFLGFPCVCHRSAKGRA
jgi:hypothetical protein